MDNEGHFKAKRSSSGVTVECEIVRCNPGLERGGAGGSGEVGASTRTERFQCESGTDADHRDASAASSSNASSRTTKEDEGRGGGGAARERAAEERKEEENEEVVWWAIDTPGLCDDEREPESLLTEIERSVAIAPDGVDAFLLVFSAAGRVTAEEIAAVDSLKSRFGAKAFADRLVVVFTHGDELEADRSTLADYLEGAPQALADLLTLSRGGVKDAVAAGERREAKCLSFPFHDKMETSPHCVTSLSRLLFPPRLQKRPSERLFDRVHSTHAQVPAREPSGPPKLYLQSRISARASSLLLLRRCVRRVPPPPPPPPPFPPLLTRLVRPYINVYPVHYGADACCCATTARPPGPPLEPRSYAIWPPRCERLRPPSPEAMDR